MTDDVFALKCLDTPWNDLGFGKLPDDHAPCPFHGGSDHFSIFRDGDGQWRYKCHSGQGLDDDSGSIIDLYAHSQGLSDKEAIKELLRIYVGGTDDRPERIERPKRKEPVWPEPTDWDPGDPEHIEHKDGRFRPGPATNEHGQLYFSQASMIDRVSVAYNGEPIAIAVCRWDLEDGSKFVRPFCTRPGDKAWSIGMGVERHHKRPLHNFDDLVDNPDAPVILVEGEKCMRAMEQALFDAWLDEGSDYSDYIVTSVIQGTNSIPYTSFRELGGDREVIVLPDLDEPGVEAVEKLREKIDTFRVIWVDDVPDPLPEGGGKDVADVLAENYPASYILHSCPDEWVTPPEPEEEEDEIFDFTYGRQTELPIENYTLEERLDDEGNVKTYRAKVSSDQILETIHQGTGNFPRLMDDLPIVRGQNFGKFGAKAQISTIDNGTSLRSWLDDIGDVYWTQRDVTLNGRKTYSVSMGQLHEKLKRVATHRYDKYEPYPHYPPIEDILYTTQVEPGDGSTLRTFIDMLNPDSDIDRELLKAATITPFWGGEPGQRPVFVIRTDHGRGVGKTSTVQAIANIYGGSLAIGDNAERAKLMERILSDEGLNKRIIFLDNLKGALSSSDYEDLITADRLSGKRMYHGELSIPNLMTWFITSNSLELSTDLASRAVVINIGPKQHNFNFKREVKKLLDAKHVDLMGDIKAFLMDQPRCELGQHTRFVSWDEDVVTRFSRGDQMIETILKRAGDVDEGARQADEVLSAFNHFLRRYDMTAETAHVIIHTDHVTDIAASVLDEFSVSTKQAYALMREVSLQPAFAGYTIETGARTRNFRGLKWRGPDAHSDSHSELDAA